MDKADGSPTFLEIPLTKTKTTNRTRSLLTKKVAAGHGDGLDNSGWAASWLKVRKDHGLDASVNLCILPAFSPSEGWMKRRMRADEFNRNLKRLLSILGVPPTEKTTGWQPQLKGDLAELVWQVRRGKRYHEVVGVPRKAKR